MRLDVGPAKLKGELQNPPDIVHRYGSVKVPYLFSYDKLREVPNPPYLLVIHGITTARVL